VPLEISPFSLHDALPILLEYAMDVIVDVALGIRQHLARRSGHAERIGPFRIVVGRRSDQHHRRIEKLAAKLRQRAAAVFLIEPRSEEHTSELQSLAYLVC